jgi:hypothetical protein
MVRTLFHMLPVREQTRERVRYLKAGKSYDDFINSLMNDYERKSLTELRYSLRSEK